MVPNDDNIYLKNAVITIVHVPEKVHKSLASQN